MTAQELFEDVLSKAQEFGMIAKNDGRTIIDPKGNTIVRNNLLDISFNDGSAYFGFLNSEEETAGPYSDFSFVVFPEKEMRYCVVSLGVGSSGFRNDYSLASHPGLRRTFLKLRTSDDLSFFKTSFDDIESSSSDLLTKIRTDFPNLKTVIESYKTVLPASHIVRFDFEEDALKVIYTWLATYAKIRNWGTQAQRKVIQKYLDGIPSPEVPNEQQDILKLLNKRHYIVLQGAPGTGKTYNALKIAGSGEYQKFFFEQFHAETTYSDFVYGLEPNLKAIAGQSQFKPKEGILYQAINYALTHESEKVLLIIDEINRANLSNVLGPVFYLLENNAGNRPTEVKIGDLELKKLPENMDVIATMNTADRSLAVVDFALRRRFAWYTIRPHHITVSNGQCFMKEHFDLFANIFYEFATDDELNLQPGPSYFIVDNGDRKDEMKNRMIYELLPLIKEYLAEGYLLKAKDSFCDLFLRETGLMMYE